MRYAVMKVLYPESIICLWSHQLQSLPAERLLIPYVGFQPDLDNSHFSNQLIIYYFNGRKGVLINLSGHRHVLDCVGNFVIHRFLVRYSVSGMEWMGCTPAFSIFPFLSMECVCVCGGSLVGGNSRIFAHFAAGFDLKTIQNTWKHHDFLCHYDFTCQRSETRLYPSVMTGTAGSVSNLELIHQAISLK